MNRVVVSPQYLQSLAHRPAILAIAQALIPEFEMWWNAGRQHADFGRNVPYHRPQDARDSAIWHVHVVPLCPPAEIIELHNWRKARRRYYRTSDRHLIYAASACGWAYLLAYEHRDAHEIADDHAYIEALAAAAEAWYGESKRFPMAEAAFPDDND
ncbi:TPA: type II toxin-antitoxin system YafO family toxin [Pseudomonas aeruginosa]